jgi:hypothetical protein
MRARAGRLTGDAHYMVFRGIRQATETAVPEGYPGHRPGRNAYRWHRGCGISGIAGGRSGAATLPQKAATPAHRPIPMIARSPALGAPCHIKGRIPVARGDVGLPTVCVAKRGSSMKFLY